MTTVRIGSNVPVTERQSTNPNTTVLTEPRALETESGRVTEATTAGKLAMGLQGSADRIVLPYAPREVQYMDLSDEWVEIQRDGGRAPLLYRKQKRLKKVRIEVWIGSGDWHQSIVSQLNMLERLGNASKPIVVVWSTWESGFWRIIDMQVTSEMRDKKGEISRAVVTIDFARASDAVPTIKSTNDGKNNNNGNGNGNNDGKDRPKKYKVKKGDTLMKIGMKYYHSQKAWRKIAKANDIKNPKPKKALKVGRVLKLP